MQKPHEGQNSAQNALAEFSELNQIAKASFPSFLTQEAALTASRNAKTAKALGEGKRRS